jgi:hypothetical protein
MEDLPRVLEYLTPPAATMTADPDVAASHFWCHNRLDEVAVAFLRAYFSKLFEPRWKKQQNDDWGGHSRRATMRHT